MSRIPTATSFPPVAARPQANGQLYRRPRQNKTKEAVELMFKRIYCVASLLLLSSVTAFAADLKIKDSRGTEVLVTNASIDYSSFTASDRETQGIRLLQGDGMVTVKWADIASLTVVRTDDSVRPARIELEVVLRNGKEGARRVAQTGAHEAAWQDRTGGLLNRSRQGSHDHPSSIG